MRQRHQPRRDGRRRSARRAAGRTVAAPGVAGHSGRVVGGRPEAQLRHTGDAEHDRAGAAQPPDHLVVVLRDRRTGGGRSVPGRQAGHRGVLAHQHRHPGQREVGRDPAARRPARPRRSRRRRGTSGRRPGPGRLRARAPDGRRPLVVADVSPRRTARAICSPWRRPTCFPQPWPPPRRSNDAQWEAFAGSMIRSCPRVGGVPRSGGGSVRPHGPLMSTEDIRSDVGARRIRAPLAGLPQRECIDCRNASIGPRINWQEGLWITQAARACSRSASRSSTVSMPTDSRTRSRRHLERRAGGAGVRHPARVLDQRLDPAERLGQDEQLRPVADLDRVLARRRPLGS